MEFHGITTFVGYGSTEVSNATVVGVVTVDPEDASAVEVFLDRTPFYAESGGQVGDIGEIRTATGVASVIDTTYAIPGLVRHRAVVRSGSIEVGEKASAHIDVAKRDATRRNHTATHLLHWALRQVLGDHVKQAGSLVGPDRLRFDFSHYEGVSSEQIHRIENLVNEVVLTAAETNNPEVTKSEAEEMGAIAFFGDKYGERVRVLQAGPSLEFCGGTHVRNVGQIGAVTVTSESSIGSNIRRIEATTGLRTIERLRGDERVLQGASSLLRVKPEDLHDRVGRLLDERKGLEKEVEQLRRQLAGGRAQTLASAAVRGVVVARVDDVAREDLKDLAIAVRDVPGVNAVILGSAPSTGGVALISAVRKDSGFHASELIAEAVKSIGGGGGKAADVALAGGRNPGGLEDALAQARAAAGIA